ncbi:MAG: copper resistance protein B [Gammaproteobacteria bacterium]|nr:copper resistance protein B [Gammaproteobacteria bacterium]
MKLLRIWFVYVVMFGSLTVGNVYAAGGDDPLLMSLKFDEFQVNQEEGETPLEWNMSAWVGKDLSKVYLKSSGEYADGEVEGMETQLLYSRAISPYWDMQFGLRQDSFPTTDRNYVAFGFMGVAPYFIETDVGLFYDTDTGQVALQYAGEMEWMITQRLVFIPELKVNLYSQDDTAIGIGSGLSDMFFGMRLAYEIKREFAPYIGIGWAKKFGSTADQAVAAGGEDSDTEVGIGVSFWF